MLETDAPYMFPKINDKKIPKDIQAKITENSRVLQKVSTLIDLVMMPVKFDVN